MCLVRSILIVSVDLSDVIVIFFLSGVLVRKVVMLFVVLVQMIVFGVKLRWVEIWGVIGLKILLIGRILGKSFVLNILLIYVGYLVFLGLNLVLRELFGLEILLCFMSFVVMKLVWCNKCIGLCFVIEINCIVCVKVVFDLCVI